MFGSGESFHYVQCNHCECLQIEAVPEDLSRHYPDQYYTSAQRTSGLLGPSIPTWFFTMDMDRIARRVLDLALGISHWTTSPEITTDLANLTQKALGVYLPELVKNPTLRVLDVGCGSGVFLEALYRAGCSNLLGVDAFVQDKAIARSPVEIHKGALESVEPTWDIVMFHHAFEHLPNPLETLRKVEKLLAPDGICLIRMPVVPSTAWQAYGVDWVHLEAPRHLFIHSEKSLQHLADEAGLRIISAQCDSNVYQFLGSEQVKRGIAMTASNSIYVNPSQSIFTPLDLLQLRQKTQAVNSHGTGDQMAFKLQKAKTL